MSGKPHMRCAIYTRKSSEEGLEQEFNSLHAQREACEAYITSQKHEGWQMIDTPYDDGGISGGTMQRPGLQQLLTDIRLQKVDVIVVYKVDRLTRSLGDFAKMVEVFDAAGVSFVSVTQQFNTTSSMGRLTLNVLLSFAQFEREVTGERIRDKIAASKKKGMWMGGRVPLGYIVQDRKLVVDQAAANIVRVMFKRYLELGCVRRLQQELELTNVGNQKTRGAIYSLLSNPVYIGQIRHKKICYPGQHNGLIDPDLWEQVQRKLRDNAVNHSGRSRKTDANILTGKLFDGEGQPLQPTHANKSGKRYRYYVSRSLLTGGKDSPGLRLPASETELMVLRVTQNLLLDRSGLAPALKDAGIEPHRIPWLLQAAADLSATLGQANRSSMLAGIVKRGDLHSDTINLTLSLNVLDQNYPELTVTNRYPIKLKRRGFEMRLIIGNDAPVNIDRVLIKTISRARCWWGQLRSGEMESMAVIATRNGVSVSYVKKLMPLAFLAPEVVESILTGTQPAELTSQKLIRQIDIPLAWAEQKYALGFHA